MVEKRDKRVEIFRSSYLPRLIDRYHPVRVLLFGSRSRGTALKESDLDLMVVSKSFEGVPFIERAYQVIWILRTPFPIEIICYTPEEYERKKDEIGIVRIASQEGVDLLSPQR